MAKASLAKRAVWRLEVLSYDLIRLLMVPFSFDKISGFGGWTLRKIGPLTSKHRIARRGLEIAFPEANSEQINRWLDAQWDNIGRTFAEFPILHRVKVFEDKSRVKINGLHHLETFRDNVTAAVVVTGHFANWEIMAAVMTQAKLPVQITYRRINNPHLDARIQAQRQAYGIKLLVPKSGPKGARQLIEALKAGESIALLNDQKFNEGLSVPFFGKDAMTAPGPTRLALKAGAPILLISTTRDKAEFTVTFHEPISLATSSNRTHDVLAGVSMITQFIEDRVRENPAQWFWVHRRWPKEVYRKI